MKQWQRKERLCSLTRRIQLHWAPFVKFAEFKVFPKTAAWITQPSFKVCFCSMFMLPIERRFWPFGVMAHVTLFHWSSFPKHCYLIIKTSLLFWNCFFLVTPLLHAWCLPCLQFTPWPSMCFFCPVMHYSPCRYWFCKNQADNLTGLRQAYNLFPDSRLLDLKK